MPQSNLFQDRCGDFIDEAHISGPLRRPPLHSWWRRTTGATFRAAGYPSLISRFGDRFLRLLLVRSGQLHRPEVDGQLIDLAVECERYLVVLVVDPRAGVDADVEGLVGHLQESDRVWLLLCVDDLIVHLQYAGAALGDAGTVIGVVEHDRVLARRECIRTFPAVLSKDEHVVVEHRLAVEQVQPPPAPAPPSGGEHSVAAALWDIDLG